MLIVDKAEIKAGFELAKKEGIIDRYIKRMFPNGLPEKYRKMMETDSELPKYSRQVILQALDFEIASAYWISPEGKIKKVKTTHVKEIVNNPEEFGLTVDYIKEVYKRHNEGIGSEGVSRDEIVKVLVLNGWTRIRYNYSGDYFSIDVGKLNEKVREYLFQWAFKTVEAYPDRQTTRVVIVEFCTMAETRYLLKDLMSDNFLGKENTQDLVIFHLIPLRKDEDFLMMGPVWRMKHKLQGS